jgi:hypothetical protein
MANEIDSSLRKVSVRCSDCSLQRRANFLSDRLIGFAIPQKYPFDLSGSLHGSKKTVSQSVVSVLPYTK